MKTVITTMKIVRLFLGALLVSVSTYSSYGQILKSIVYDFDGLDVGQNDLPEGDYSVNDLSYQVAANPLAASDILGDRVLKLNLNWNTNYGAFGRGISRYIEFNSNQDVFNFFFYNPSSNNQNATFDVVITDDDNQNNTYESSSDDTWKKSLVIPGSSGWQLISIPLKDFTDLNSGGNGLFDIAFTQNMGMLLMVEFRFTKNTSGLSNPVFYLDMINFSDGTLPRGATDFDLPAKDPSDFCLLGAYQTENKGEENVIPPHFESLFPAIAGKKIKYANWFVQWAMDGTTVPKELPGNSVQTLINNGYTPIITWEPMFQGYSRLAPQQPRLSNIINGDYNSYIDAFADKIKAYSDTVILRFMHEFEGDWYSWSLIHNNQDPSRYVAAFRTVVDRFRARGVTKVKWMWCVNSDYFPYRSFNWIVPAYPGDAYVDIIATDVYNNHWPPELPWWRSFTWQAAESYYYLTKYFPQKPLYICELGCRERFSSESPASESKGAWFARMDKQLQSNFHKARALVFFNAAPDHNWLVNSSSGSLQSLTDNIWNDYYYFKTSVPPPPPPPTATCSATGSISREIWNNVSGTSVSSIPVTAAPASIDQLSVFQAGENVADNYGQRIRGYVCPPLTGSYIFWIASDDNSELWLSTNDNPANKQKIASVSGWTFAREWTKYPTQQSVAINLMAGQKYYIEALHKEGNQGDNLAVGWQLPNALQERPIPGTRLSPFAMSLAAAITSPANNSVFSTGSNITINASASGGTGTVQKVEFFAGITKLGEDATVPYSFVWNNVALGNYELTAKATDNGNNTAVSSKVNISVNTAPTITCSATGNITREVWNNVSGTTVSSIPVSSTPNLTEQLSIFQAPENIGNNYGQRIRGYICPPLTGNYIFWIASDDNSELWLSTNDNPANKQKIASVSGWTFAREWTKYPTQQSVAINLTAGQKYYIEALHKEGDQGDNLAVGWQLPNSIQERPIQGVRLSPFGGGGTPPPPSACIATITPGGSVCFCSGGNVTLNANTGAGFSYQWKKNGVNIGNAKESSYTASSEGDYQVKISYSGCTAWSAPMHVTVNTSLTARITPGGPTTFCNNQSVILYVNTCSGYFYQWKRDGTDIPGATAANYVATISGSYQVKIIQGSSVAWSALVQVTVNNCKVVDTDQELADQAKRSNNLKDNGSFHLQLYPNPTSGMFLFDFCLEDQPEETLEYKVVNSIGQIVYSRLPARITGCIKETIELEGHLPTGIYTLQIKIANKIENTKIVLSR